MRFKNINDLTELWVTLDVPDGRVIRIPENGTAGSMGQLVSLVDVEIKSLDAQGYNYSSGIQMQADRDGSNYRAYLNKVIENIICKRQPYPEQTCYSDGVGDNLHLLSGRIDRAVGQLPKPLKSVATIAIKAATKMATGKARMDLGGCGTCGGTSSLNARLNNLGRAGYMNRKFKKFKLR